MPLKNLFSIAAQKKVALDKQKIKRAYDFADRVHKDQIRYSGEPFISHPLQVAEILVGWAMNETVIIAALLHETIENSSTTTENLRKNFGPEIASLVEKVTRVGQVKLRHSTDEAFIENARKMFIALAQDLRVILIRLADRLHNMKTLDAIPLSKQKRIARETLEVYAPLAERLGMGELKGELEDLAFPYVYPEDHVWLSEIAAPHFKTAHEQVKEHLTKIETLLEETGIDATIHGRPKHRYSLYRKLLRPEINRDISQIYDLIALRIITKDTGSCYAALGLVHQHFKPAPHLGVSDFIAQPKPNGYQSIHTKVFDSNGNIIEIQIRSIEMHHHAEYGAAAHFAYAEAKSKSISSDKLAQIDTAKMAQKMNWVEQLANWQEELKSNQDFVNLIKLDALNRRIYVFSPKGDVFDLPADSTPVDFAYAVHTDLIDYIGGAKVNNRLVPLEASLKSGDLVEIIKSKVKKLPSKNWLKFVKTHHARIHIARALEQKLL